MAPRIGNGTAAALGVLLLAGAAACGGGRNGSVEGSDAGPEAGFDAGEADGGWPDAMPSTDAGADGGADGGADAGADGGADGGGVDAGPDASGGYCDLDAHCDDGQACTTDRCEEGVCVHAAEGRCDWPAEPTSEATNLTDVEGPFFDNDFHRDLSGAVWNPVDRTLWLVRNGGPSKVWALEEDGRGGYRVATRGGTRAEWSRFGDAEAITLVDFAEVDRVYVLIENAGAVAEYDLSVGGVATETRRWDLSAWIGSSGGEGLTFVPDAYLAAQGFVDGDGNPFPASEGGLGGLFLVGHQGGGAIFAFDPAPDGSARLVGRYETGAAETAGLEFDRSSGQLLVWHDADFDLLEVTRLSSSPLPGGGRRLDPLVVYRGPAPLFGMSTNREGIAVKPLEDCRDGRRDLFMTIDGGRAWSLFVFHDWPC